MLLSIKKRLTIILVYIISNLLLFGIINLLFDGAFQSWQIWMNLTFTLVIGGMVLAWALDKQKDTKRSV